MAGKNVKRIQQTNLKAEKSYKFINKKIVINMLKIKLLFLSKTQRQNDV